MLLIGSQSCVHSHAPVPLFLQNNDWLGGPTPACYHRRRALFLHLLPGHRYCQSLSSPCRWLPPPFPYPPPTRTHSGWPLCTQVTKTAARAVERRMRGKCADHGATGIKLATADNELEDR